MKKKTRPFKFADFCFRGCSEREILLQVITAMGFDLVVETTPDGKNPYSTTQKAVLVKKKKPKVSKK